MNDTLINILKKCNGNKVHEERNLDYERIELIIYRKDMENWIKIFNEEVGPAVKIEGEKPTDDHQEITKEFGGINQYQVLFKKDVNGKSVIAMFWPWGDDEHVTLHMVLID